MLTQTLRPQKFSELVGCEEQSLLLKSCILKEDRPSTYILCGNLGSGKAQPVDLIIPTPDGNRRFGDLKVGDYVFDKYGKPTKVLGVFNRGRLPNYKVTFEDGRYTYCNKDHLWTVKSNNENESDIVITTEQMLLSGIFNPDCTCKYKIPMNGPVEYATADLPVDPYILGCFIGGGNFKEKLLTLSCEDFSVLNRISEILNIQSIECNDPIHHYKFKMNGKSEDSYLSLEDIIDNDVFKLSGTLSKNKFIPEIYKYSSIQQRIELIRGLIDTNTRVNEENEDILDYFTISYQLALDVRSILVSLGIKCHTKEYKKDGDIACYVISIDTASHMSNLILGKNREYQHTGISKSKLKYETSYVSIVSIDNMDDEKEMICIKVDNKDELYLTNDYIVTHNTTSARLFARGINCVNFSKCKDVCGECSFCKSDLNTVPWYLELDASHVGTVDNVRSMQDILYPVSAYTRVVVFDEAHLISRQAQSALLKMFEDTPVGIIFILVTTDPENILETIRNRSLIIYYSQKSDESIYEHVKSNFKNLKEETINKIVRDSHGIMRECHMILERINLIGEDKYNELNFNLDSYFTDYIKALLTKDKDLLFKSIDGISTRPVATIKIEYQDYLFKLVRDSFKLDSLSDSLRDNIIKRLQKENKLIQLVRLLGQDWVMSSFRSQIEMSTALMAIYQQINVN